jgi:gamma-glutamylcyclotransferase (GGCT)/AIG2-like uncharacterized protein YtfP
MPPPEDLALPLFVYGALKPGLPAYEQLQGFVADARSVLVPGQLWVRDGLPLLRTDEPGEVYGFLLTWKPGSEKRAYNNVCAFEPRKHYQWSTVTVDSGSVANVLTALDPDDGNPVFLPSPVWRISDDPAFGVALDEVQAVLEEVEQMQATDDRLRWKQFYRAQMAYLLLWSVVERLSALCLGPANEPMKRVNRLHELVGIPEIVAKHVRREDKVADSRDPGELSRLNARKPKKVFQYYYQVRSNLSHRGKAVFKDFDKVHFSLKELLGIVTDYLASLRSREGSQS